MGENYQKPTRPSRLGLRNAAGGGEIVEVQGGHIVRSTGRKDRHSKVCTAKGPRDRRVRLSAHTAIQFYDVQDRLGYDRPSKAVDWLIKKAKSAIDELAELPAWKPTATAAPNSTAIMNFEQNPDEENLNHHHLSHLEEHPDDEIVDNHMGNNQNSSFLPTPLDSIKSFFPMGDASSTTPPPPNNNNNNSSGGMHQFHHNFAPSELLSRTNTQHQDLKLSLQSIRDPILQQPPPHHHHHQTEQGNNVFFDGSGWPENGGFQRLVSWGGDAAVSSGSGFMFTSPPPPPTTQTQPFLQPFLGQPTNNQLLNYISQRGPLQSSNSPPVRAWVDPQPFSGAGIDNHQTLSFHYPSGFTSGFPGFHIPARIQGEEEEHDGGISDKPSSASSDSRH